MPDKSFSLYSDKEDLIPANARLVVEIAKVHIAFICREENKKTITAFELFTFTEDEATNFPKLFTAITAVSKLADKTFAATDVFINNEFCIPVPIFKFSREIAADYLDIVFGNDSFAKVHYDHIAIEPGIINVYRVGLELINILNQRLANASFRHTYSNIIKTVISDISEITAQYIYIRFYNTSIIAAVIKNKKLQLIQTFMYQTPEDVLYCLLNITERFQLNVNDLTLQISGMIDLNFTMYRELITYFRNVEVRNTDTSKLLPDIKEYPLHYFTPFFNLAL